MRIRDLGYSPGILPTGPKNSILDIEGLSISQHTIHEVHGEDDVHKGVTIILPRPADQIHKPCYAGIHTLNGNGEVSGSYQIKEWGYINTPLALTNSLSFGNTFQATWDWLLAKRRAQGANDYAVSRDYGTPIVGETCDWWLNNIEKSRMSQEEIKVAFEKLGSQTEVEEGSFGGGAGMSCHMFKGGTGTSSRVVEADGGKKFTFGVIVQSNYGLMHDLVIGGVPVGKILVKEKKEKGEKKAAVDESKVKDGSIVIMIITDAPFLPHQLTRLAQRATVGLCRVAGYGAGKTHSGDIFVALSTANTPDEQLTGRVSGKPPPLAQTITVEAVKNEAIDEMFRAVAEATEEAILNSLVGSRDGMKGSNGVFLDGLPVDRVKEILAKHLVVD